MVTSFIWFFLSCICKTERLSSSFLVPTKCDDGDPANLKLFKWVLNNQKKKKASIPHKSNYIIIIIRQRLVFWPAGFHAQIIGFPHLVWTCQCALELLAHLFSHGKVQGVTCFSLGQKYPGIAAAPRTHCRSRKIRLVKCCTRFTLFFSQ